MSTPTKVTRDIPQAANIKGFDGMYTPGQWWTGMSAERRQAHLNLMRWLGSHHQIVTGQYNSIVERFPANKHGLTLTSDQLLEFAELNPGVIETFIADRIALEAKAAGVNKKK